MQTRTRKLSRCLFPRSVPRVFPHRSVRACSPTIPRRAAITMASICRPRRVRQSWRRRRARCSACRRRVQGGLKSWCSTTASSASTATWAGLPHRLPKAKESSRQARSSVLSEERGSPSARTSISRCSSPESRSIRLPICAFRNAAVRLGHRHLRLHRVRNEANLVGFETRVMPIGGLDRPDRMPAPTPDPHSRRSS
jgi:hypothetical protein